MIQIILADFFEEIFFAESMEGVIKVNSHFIYDEVAV
jgi:hypothetical protein